MDLPNRIHGDRSRYSLIATPAGGLISGKVPVRTLKFDSTTSSYSAASAYTPPITLSFPIAQPGNSSTASPAQPAQPSPYTGVTLTPLLIEPETLPAAHIPDFRDCIYCFPADSGLPPIYVVFNSAYEGATTRGEYSGRLYNPDTAGGPILDLDWTAATVTQEGIALVKLHTGRFDHSDGNAVMIGRLEQILQGELTATDTDKRFYTHEIRELERYRALGILDGVRPLNNSVWNDTHSASLEDYKLNSTEELLYTPEAITADNEQTEKMFKNGELDR